MSKLRFAMLGAGFWPHFQIPGWQELSGVECMAICDIDKSKAADLAEKYKVPSVYDSPEEMLRHEKLDFIDICTPVETHLPLAQMAAQSGLHVVCQKPMAPSMAMSRAMLENTRNHNVKLFVNENFRWQAPMRALKTRIESGIIGSPFKARVSFCSAFPVFDNQPFLAKLEHFILTDIGSHVLDVCRFLFGEAERLYCSTQRINPAIEGEDVANVLMTMKDGLSCFAEMSYASLLECEAFPQVLVVVEGSHGSIQLSHDYTLKTTTHKGTDTEIITPKMYDWLDPAYAVVHSSIVDCQRNILQGLNGGAAETTGEDNLKTVDLVWKSYESAASGQVVEV